MFEQYIKYKFGLYELSRLRLTNFLIMEKFKWIKIDYTFGNRKSATRSGNWESLIVLALMKVQQLLATKNPTRDLEIKKFKGVSSESPNRI